MGRNKYSAGEIKEIGKLLRLKNAGNRLQQKMIRHDLRVDYEFNISDFNEPGKACGKKIPYEIKPRRAGDIATCYCDPSKAKRELGWEAEYGIDEMCADSWKWQSMNPDGYRD